ncbi:hypothetical protein [Algoriphagus sp.]|uniref:hypothetical protein n=1 Tax=Algoriphagus sp. TaxID=1872435 RepID=UPI002720C4C5|nr:hypothetical protein [Algoriphagus sp.]MDO8969027.1 hypothetical protein [Algoriphagus sp.]MDP3200258.1 hypothetical protein [Algoriphagus sp.]
MTPLEDIKVYAYLTPHPLEEDSFLEEEWISWLPGYKAGESEDGDSSIWREENIALYEKIENYSANVLKAALERMWPLLDGIYFNQIQLAIDYTNYKSSDALAGYDLYLSDPAKGNYVFHVDQSLLNRYLHFFNGNEKALPNMNIWEHELVHLKDHWQLVKASAFKNSAYPLNNLEYYLLKYREEGIANLFDLLDGKIQTFKSIAEAKRKFILNYTEVNKRLQPMEKSTEKDRMEIYSGLDFYEIGPWLILDMLNEIPMVTDIVDIESLEKNIADGIILEDSVKLEILKNTFYIDNNWFLGRLKLDS